MDIESSIRQFIITNLYYTETGSIPDHASFLETGIVDSMGVMELVSFVEAEFGISVHPKEVVVENFDSISRLARFIRSKLPAYKQQVVA